jgi:hypothetical protein
MSKHRYTPVFLVLVAVLLGGIPTSAIAQTYIEVPVPVAVQYPYQVILDAIKTQKAAELKALVSANELLAVTNDYLLKAGTVPKAEYAMISKALLVLAPVEFLGDKGQLLTPMKMVADILILGPSDLPKVVDMAMQQVTSRIQHVQAQLDGLDMIGIIAQSD